MHIALKRFLDNRPLLTGPGAESKLSTLLELLNGANLTGQESRARGRLLGLLNQLSQTQQICNLDARRSTNGFVPNKNRDSALAELNKRVSRYRISPVCTFSERYGLIVRYRITGTSLTRLFEAQAASFVISLAVAGKTEKLRACDCGKWFVGRTHTQLFCSAKCRVRHFKSSEKWKAHHRDYMRDYYRLKMSGKVK